MKLLRPLFVAILAVGASFSAVAADCQLRVELAWGTDGARPEGKELAELDGKAREKLRHFRWKNYWVVKSETQAVDSKEAHRVALDRCLVELKASGSEQVEVRLFSAPAGKEPKLIKTVQHSLEALKRGEFLIIAGDDKEKWDDAWFVIIRKEN
jgi:hypothetical protein